MHAPDKPYDYYLKRNIYGKYQNSGTPFIDIRNTGLLTDFCTLVSGHQVNDGSMFSDMLKFEEQDYYDMHKSFYIITSDKRIRLDVFACIYIRADDDMIYSETFNLRDECRRYDYLSYIKKNSLINTDANPSIYDRIIAFSTCQPKGKYEKNGRNTVFCKVSNI